MKDALIKKTINNIQELIAQIQVAVDEGGRVMVDGNSEEAIAWLLKLEEKVKEAKENIEKKILEEAEKQMENFRGMQGELIKFRRYQGYKLVDKDKAKAFVKTITRTYSIVDKNLVEDYYQKVGELPEGIEKNDKLRVSLKEKYET